MSIADIYAGDRSGIDVRAYRDGLAISGWYDTHVGIEGTFLTWEQIEELRRKGKRRVPHGGQP